MKEQDLDQFLVDYHPEDSLVEVDAQWLQSILREFATLSSLNVRLQQKLKRKEEEIDNLSAAIQIYKYRESLRIRLVI